MQLEEVGRLFHSSFYGNRFVLNCSSVTTTNCTVFSGNFKYKVGTKEEKSPGAGKGQACD